MTNPDDLITDFKTWYDAVWLGDKEHGQFIPNTHDLDYLEYLNGYTLAHGAWQAALSTIPAARSDKGEACAILLESGEFIKTSDLESRRIRAPLSYLEEAWKGSKLLYLAAPQQAIPAELKEFAEAVKGLCNDFSSRTGNVYIKDVQSAIDGLLEQHLSAAPTAPIESEFLDAVREVIRISDRKHDAWDKVKEYL
jgi:hypothetical protein